VLAQIDPVPVIPVSYTWDLPLVVALLVAAALTVVGSWWFARNILKSARDQARSLAELTLREAEITANRIRTEADLELQRGRSELDLATRNLAQAQAAAEKRESSLQLLEERLRREREAVEDGRNAIRALNRQVRLRLQEVSSLSPEQARERLLEEMRQECAEELRRERNMILSQAEEALEQEARARLVAAMQRLSHRPAFDLSATIVALPNDEMKGRIIGREGRNIKAFEAATGVTLLIDDAPQTVLISCFDPVRREVARLALERLVADGRIHPAMIEETVQRSQSEVDENVLRTGEQTAERLRVSGLPPEILSLLGRLKFRFSYAQNVLDHSIEVAQLCSMLASEIGLDPSIARKAGLLHDIGKAIEGDYQGSHATAGAEFVKRHGEGAIVCNAIAAHHEEVPCESLYAGLVILADKVSAVRPGARAESMASYIERIDRLERLALSLPGVQAAYAISAGREIRVIVSPSNVDDAAAADLARRLRRSIEESLSYPSTIKVTVVREQRFVETAR
jgi:ribonuclease Y